MIVAGKQPQRLDDEAISALLRAGMSGDDAAYQSFFRNITPVLKAMVTAIARPVPVEERKDIMQDVLLSLHNKCHTWQQDRPVLPWIYAITRHKTIDFLRRYQRRSGNGGDLDIDAIIEILPARMDDPSVLIDLEAAMGKLTDNLSTSVRLMGLEGKSAAEAGADLGVSENAARINFHRGMKKLRQLLSLGSPEGPKDE
jgi:RNA polymerase sigma-70 factor (ECF subfamily)